MAHDLRAFVDRSLRVLEHEGREAYAELCRAMDTRRIRVVTDPAPFAIRCDGAHVQTRGAEGDEEIVAAIGGADVLALVDGVLSLEEALRQDRLIVQADLRDAAIAFDVLLLYVRAGIRCPSFPALLDSFRAMHS